MRQPIRVLSGLFVHVLFAAILVWVAAQPTPRPSPEPMTKAVVWRPNPGFNGGGNGGDGRKAAPLARRSVAPPSATQFLLPRMPDVLSKLELPGPVVLAASGLDRLGRVDGAGTDGKGEGTRGPGSGPGTGPGAGPGDGPFPDGTPGLTSPQVIFERAPEYTAEAMKARIQGAVLLEAT